MKKTIFAVLIVALALTFVTCQPELAEGIGDDGIEYTDWEYEIDADGTGRMTMYLDGYQVPVRSSRQRALNLELAKMSHDFFEAVFVGADGHVARTTWEIGQPAGISGVRRSATQTYDLVAGTSSSVVYVGKKTPTPTLLAIGVLIAVKDGPPSSTPRGDFIVSAAAQSVTYRVYPVTTEVGFVGDTVTLKAAGTFKTAAGDTTSSYTSITAGNTLGSNVNLSRAGTAVYPWFTLPEIPSNLAPEIPGSPPTPAVTRTIKASYTITGLTSTAESSPYPTTNFAGDLLTSAMVVAPLEAMKRVPAYILNGVTYDASGVMDQGTIVTPTNNITGPTTATPPVYTAFLATTDFDLIQTYKSTGIFAFTFQVPVYAITGAATNNGGPEAQRWYIRPGYQQYQFLLDDGENMGGAIMIGTGAGISDWLDIFTVGVGFNN